MTRIFVKRGGGGSSSNLNRHSVPGASSVSTPQQAVNPATPIDEDQELELSDLKGSHDNSGSSSEHEDKSVHKSDVLLAESSRNLSELACRENFFGGDGVDEGAGVILGEFRSFHAPERFNLDENEALSDTGSQNPNAGLYPPPPPPLPPLKPATSDMALKHTGSGGLSSVRTGCSTNSAAAPNVLCHSPAVSRPPSPKSCSEAEGYNSADEQVPCFRPSSYNDVEKERQFEADIRRIKGLEVRRMLGDGNCLFRAVADQVYGDSEEYDLVRQMCIDYMESERDYFSQFITEGFTSYCKRKKRDKVYGNNVEIQALSEMYNQPIHIYSYNTKPINICQGRYDSDLPPIRLSYHQGNHYNSLVDPRRSNIGAGLGFSSLRGKNIDKHQIKAAINAQQDHQIENALLAEGRFYSDLELTEKEIERMVMETSRAEYLADSKLKQVGFGSSSTSGAEPSSSGARKVEDGSKSDEGKTTKEAALSSNTQMLLSMGFGYFEVMEARSIFGDDVDSMLCYLLEMGDGSPMRVDSLSQRYKGKASE